MTMTGYPDVGLYVGGSWRTTADNLPVIDPANGQVIGRLARAGPQDLDDVLEAASKGFEVWSQTAPKDRADLLRAAAALMRERQAEIAHDITRELGKPYPQAKLEVIRGCEFFERAVPGSEPPAASSSRPCSPTFLTTPG